MLDAALMDGSLVCFDFMQGTQENADELVDMTSVAEFDGILEALAYVINKISCEVLYYWTFEPTYDWKNA